ncbi:hypothetical protein ACROYT_G019268 [Oculina patagonica]
MVHAMPQLYYVVEGHQAELLLGNSNAKAQDILAINTKGQQAMITVQRFPDTVKTEGGPPFIGTSSHKNQMYMKWAGVKTIVVSPEDPEANGLAENFMKPLSIMATSESAQAARDSARQFDEFVEQEIERMPQMSDPIREAVRNILDEPIPLEMQERLLKPILSQKYYPKPPKRLRRKEKKEQKRKNIQNEFDHFLPHENRVVTNYQNEILNLLDAAE